MPSRRLRRRAGFTIVEIMVVAIVVAVLASAIMLPLLGRVGKAKQSVAKQQVASLETAIYLFSQDYGRFPESLAELTERPSDVPPEQWTPPSIKSKDLADPWGRPWEYRFPGENGAFDLYSLGADGQEGGEGEAADVVNW